MSLRLFLFEKSHYSLPIAEANFNTSLSNRKAEIRSLIKEAITSMTDDEEEEDADDEEEEDAKGGNRVG